MGCLFAIFAGTFPRLGTLIVWLARPQLFSDAFGGSWLWPVLGGSLLVAAWGGTLLGQRCNARDQGLRFHAVLLGAAALAVAGGAALIAGPYQTGLDPTENVYGATVWLLVLWTVAHVAVGIIMQLYCVARRFAGHMTARHAIDIGNVALYWHFTLLTAVMTVLVIAGFPWLV